VQVKSYLPNVNYTPGLTQALEVKGDLGIKAQNLGEESEVRFSPSANIAFSPVNHLGLTAGYIADNKIIYDISDPFWSSNEEDQYLMQGRKFTVAAGFYSGGSERSSFEIYAGYSRGNFSLNRYEPFQQKYYTHYYEQYHIQPAYVLKVDKKKVYLEFSAGARVKFQNTTDLKAYDPQVRYQLTEPESDVFAQNYWFVDPLVNFAVGHPYVQFHLQMGVHLGLTSPTLIYSDVPYYLALGVAFRFAPLVQSKAD